MTTIQARKPGAMKSFMNGLISVTACCSGALSAMTMLPMIQRRQPSQPKNVKVSCGPEAVDEKSAGKTR